MYKELNQLLEKARKGDIDNKEEILERLKPLIIKSIQRYYNNKAQFQDLIQEGYLVLLECIESYDESKGTYFLGYVKTMLKFTYLNKHKERIHISLNTPVGEDGSEELINVLESEEANQVDILLSKEEDLELLQALFQLTDRQREVVMAFYIENLSIHDISKRLGITYRTVVNTKTRALEKLKKQMHAGNY